MKESTIYICDFCRTQYNNKSKAEECESNHKKVLGICNCKWLPIKNDFSGLPHEIEVEMKSGEIAYFRREKYIKK